MKIKAATLLELMVALAIGSILLTTIFLAYTWVVNEFSRAQADNAAFLRFQSELNVVQQDVQRANRIIQTRNTLEFEGDVFVKYVLEANSTVRISSSGNDTLLLTMANFNSKLRVSSFTLSSTESPKEIIISKKYPFKTNFYE